MKSGLVSCEGLSVQAQNVSLTLENLTLKSFDDGWMEHPCMNRQNPLWCGRLHQLQTWVQALRVRRRVQQG